MSLAKQTLSGLVWTSISRFGTRFSIFIVGIILARLLSPKDFGLVAMLSIFFELSNSITDSGFSTALIREKSISETDKNTAFSINLIASILLYTVLWFGSPTIAEFFDQPQLIWLTRIMGIDLIFRAFGIVQRAILVHDLQFKILSKIDISISVITGVVAIFLAYSGLGVWALGIKYFLSSVLTAIVLNLINPWLPKGFINQASFKKLFGFGSRIMLTSLLNTFYNNIYNLIIGKSFSPATLGLYNRAFTFTNQTIASVLHPLQQVTYPVLSKKIDDRDQLLSAYRKIIRTITFINIPLIVMLGFIAKPLILVILGEKWIEVVPFMQLLCFSAIIMHISSINQNLFKVIGRSDLYFRLALLTKAFTTIAIIVSFRFGIWGLVVSSILSQYFEVILGMLLSSKQIKYPVLNQLRDLLPTVYLVIPMIIVLSGTNMLTSGSNIFQLTIRILAGFGTYIILAISIKSSVLHEIRETIEPFFLRKAINEL